MADYKMYNWNEKFTAVWIPIDEKYANFASDETSIIYPNGVPCNKNSIEIAIIG